MVGKKEWLTEAIANDKHIVITVYPIYKPFIINFCDYFGL
jgi:hypothetical protein